MATDKKTSNVKNRAAAPDDDFPISATRTRAEGWAVKETGTVIVGRLLGRIKTGTNRDGTDKYSFQLRIGDDIRGSVPVKIMRGSGEDASEEIISSGIVNVDQNAALSDLVEFSRDGNVYDVRIEYLGKTKSRTGDFFWDIGIRLRPVPAGK